MNSTQMVCAGGFTGSSHGNDGGLWGNYLYNPYGSGGGGGGTGEEIKYIPPIIITPRYRQINNLVKNPCISKVVDKSIDSNLTNSISKLVNLAFGKNEFFDLNIDEEDFNDRELDGQASFQSAGEDSFRADVVINSFLGNSSHEYIMATVYHELLHAYLGHLDLLNSKGGTSDGPANTHDNMADNYLSILTQALMENYSISRKEAEALSWGGLQFTNKWKTQVSNKDYIAYINYEYKKGNKGTKCK